MNLGIIGYGARIRHVAEEIRKQDPSVRIAAICDPKGEQIAESFRLEGLEPPAMYATPEELLEHPDLQGVLIGTRCSLHTEMALKVLPTGIPLFLEKPVSITIEEAHRLKRGYEEGKSDVVVSFPLRVTSIVKLVKEIVDSGKIGTVEHVQAINNVPYGGVYYHNWYRNEKETGGLFLQKATHDFDYINHVLGLKPVRVCAMTSKQIFKGDKPAGLTCPACDEKHTCMESVVTHAKGRHAGDACAFAVDTGNEDSGSALIQYESGMHVSYSQNFFARRKAGARGARFLGYAGTLEFDFMTGLIKVYMHHTPRVETYELEHGEGHFGGDAALARNFTELMSGTGRSVSTLGEGLLSALMCIRATESARTGSFQEIAWEDARYGLQTALT
ncbi:oxidoreductase [Paenibacillus sp. J31TS4]|uniref:Gfo/Idh/MocA family protein n=1 Tax=Paenibacillus sp. J31TS4 TaxID=2807195 RepID=UPI001B233D5D|nr:Gfo/Idh/MocA family oxidoreductase [Paenibacillus sp. J31TS4]GIP38359.1 oxidoreductase [Paenibacillus sp. J31TS4]